MDRLRVAINAMFVPVRCYSCAKVVGHLVGQFQHMKTRDEGESTESMLNRLNISRTCCRRMVMGHSEKLADTVLMYEWKTRSNPGGPTQIITENKKTRSICNIR